MRFRYDKDSENLIVSESSRVEYHQIKIWMTRKIKGWKFLPAVKMGIWNGDVSLFDNGKVNLGLWRECYKACKEIGVTFNIDNKEDFPLNRDVTLEKVTDFCKEFFKNHKVKNKDNVWIPFFPYDHQIESAYRILKNRYCLAEVATSGGKSLIISIVYFYTLKNVNPDAKLLAIVPSISLVTQLYNDITSYNYGNNYIDKHCNLVDFRNSIIDSIIDDDYNPCTIRIEEVMSDTPRKQLGQYSPNVYIGTYQSLVNYPKEFFHQFHTVVVDEAHQGKSASIKSILSKTFNHAYNRFGVSGTFPSEESLEILVIQSLLGPIITEVSASELKEKGIITPMSIKVLVLNHNEKELSERLSAARKSGAGAEVFRYEKDFIHLSEKRMSFIKKIITKCDKNTLLLFHTIEYGQKIFNTLSEEFTDKEFYYIDGSVSGKNREEIKKKMEITGEKPKILIASFGTLSTGISLKNLHYLIMVDSFKSEQVVIQSIGRLLRLFSGKEKAIIFDLVDVFDEKMKNILYSHWLDREKMYKKRRYPYKEIKVNL